LRAKRTFNDCFDKERKAGEEWIITYDDHEVHVPGVYEEVVQPIHCIVVNSRQYCIINNPVGEDGKPQLGRKKIIKGHACFFLKVGESVLAIKDIYVLNAEDALQVRAIEEFEERRNNRTYKWSPGQKFYIYGPQEYCPPLEAEVLSRRRALIQYDSLGFFALYSYSSKLLSIIMAVALVFYLYRLNVKEL